MSADLLREAAAELRAVVGKLTTDTARWDEAFPSRPVYGDHHTYERVFVHPAAILATADWLDAEVRQWDKEHRSWAERFDPSGNHREPFDAFYAKQHPFPVAVARAYLGRPA